jgi:hypothetical protein
VSVVYCEPTALLLKNPLELLARSRSHVVAGDLRPPGSADGSARPPKRLGTLPGEKRDAVSAAVELGRIDPSFVFLRASNHVLAALPKVVSSVRAKDGNSPADAFGHVLNAGPGGFVTWDAQPRRDPHLRRDQTGVDGSTPSGLRLTLWQDATLRKFGCGQKAPLSGVTVLNCVFASFSFGERLEGATEPQVVEAGLRALGAWVLAPNWPQVKAQATLQQWLALAHASSAQVKSGIACRAAQGDAC